MGILASWILSASAFLALTCISFVPGSSSSPEIRRSVPLGGDKAELSNRKLIAFLDATSTFSTTTSKGVLDSYNLEDYPGHDPSPNSEVDVHSGPIENGVPLRPYYAPVPSPHAHRHVHHGHASPP